jgi:hypothetical protein
MSSIKKNISSFLRHKLVIKTSKYGEKLKIMQISVDVTQLKIRIKPQGALLFQILSYFDLVSKVLF